MQLVSIIIPMYNSAKWIRQAIDSVLNQTWSNIEVIVVDDGSQDDGPKIVSSYNSDKIKLILQPPSGVCVTRNLGLKHASGSYVQYLDADDFLGRNKIELQMMALDDCETKLAVCPTVHFDDGCQIDETNMPNNAYLVDSDNPVEFLINLWGGNNAPIGMVQTSAWLTPTSLLKRAGPWNESLLRDNDGEFFARVLLRSKGVVVVPQARNYYRKCVGGISTKCDKTYLESTLRALELKAGYLLSQTQDHRAKNAIAKLYFGLARQFYTLDRNVWNVLMRRVNEYNTFFVPNVSKPYDWIFKYFGYSVAEQVACIKRALSRPKLFPKTP